MRNWKLYPLLAAILIVLAMLVAPATAMAQEEGQTTITFAGQPLSGNADELVAFVMNDLRPAVATADKPLVVETEGTFRNFVPRSTCFGVVERQADGMYKLLETVYKTDMSNGRYDAVVPSANEHGDWPPHLINFKISSTQPLGCDELIAEISYRWAYQPDQAGGWSTQFELDQEFLEEYDVMASGGDLGLFVASPTPTVLTVNGETFESQGCSDCLDHTAAVTNTIGAGVYSPATVTWLSETTKDPTALKEMYVLPVPKEAGVKYTVTVEIAEEAFENATKPIVYLWFGRFDMPQ